MARWACVLCRREFPLEKFRDEVGVLRCPVNGCDGEPYDMNADPNAPRRAKRHRNRFVTGRPVQRMSEEEWLRRQREQREQRQLPQDRLPERIE